MTDINDLDITWVNLGPEVKAGFTNRTGGVSTGCYSKLNLGAFVADDPEAVAINRHRVGESLGAPIVFSTQVHGNEVIEVTETQPWLANEPPISVGSADGLITCTTIGLGVLVADCVPILLGSKNVVAVAHAGRQGVQKQVLAAVVARMRLTGAEDIRAAIGPAVCGLCYEVPLAMQNEVCEITPQAFSSTPIGTPALDLPKAVATQLLNLGVEVSYRSAVCTVENEDFFSHRRSTSHGQKSGRQAGVIRLLSN